MKHKLTHLMQIQIDNSSPRPVYQQITDHIKRVIAMDKLIKEEKLSTIRELAVQLTLNPNTIAKAYRQLKQEGVIVTRLGAGTFVANLDSSLSRAIKKKIVSDELERIVAEAYHMQIDSQTLAEWFRSAVEKFTLTINEGQVQSCRNSLITATERRNEIGIRMALGADDRDILSLVIKKALVLTIIGLMGALAICRLMASLLYGISIYDQATFVLVPALLLGVSMLACYFPARWAAKIDPMEALRYE